MDLSHFRAAVAVADTLSFRQAAVDLHTTQSSLSYVISKVEAELGVSLFERLPRGIQVTEAGRAFVAHARRVARETDRARHAIATLRGSLAGSLALAVSAQSAMVSGDLIGPLRRLHPSVVPSFREVDEDEEVIHLLRCGNVEMGLVASDVPIPENLEARWVADDSLVAVVPAAWEHRTPGSGLDLTELAAFPLIGPPAGTRTRQRWGSIFDSVGARPHVVAECASSDMLLELVTLGLGAAVVTCSMTRRFAREAISVHPLRPARIRSFALIFEADGLSTIGQELLRTALEGSGTGRVAGP